ncbi:hypothetical protein DFH06DRAFT_1359695 [Mycena polygramma]|nr:hypothetical protein DFH06DRAFT_1359695 [Mycena polygramma]
MYKLEVDVVKAACTVWRFSVTNLKRIPDDEPSFAFGYQYGIEATGIWTVDRVGAPCDEQGRNFRSQCRTLKSGVEFRSFAVCHDSRILPSVDRESGHGTFWCSWWGELTRPQERCDAEMEECVHCEDHEELVTACGLISMKSDGVVENERAKGEIVHNRVRLAVKYEQGIEETNLLDTEGLGNSAEDKIQLRSTPGGEMRSKESCDFGWREKPDPVPGVPFQNPTVQPAVIREVRVDSKKFRVLAVAVVSGENKTPQNMVVEDKPRQFVRVRAAWLYGTATFSFFQVLSLADVGKAVLSSGQEDFVWLNDSLDATLAPTLWRWVTLKNQEDTTYGALSVGSACIVFSGAPMALQAFPCPLSKPSTSSLIIPDPFVLESIRLCTRSAAYSLLPANFSFSSASAQPFFWTMTSFRYVPVSLLTLSRRFLSQTPPLPGSALLPVSRRESDEGRGATQRMDARKKEGRGHRCPLSRYCRRGGVESGACSPSECEDERSDAMTAGHIARRRERASGRKARDKQIAVKLPICGQLRSGRGAAFCFGVRSELSESAPLQFEPDTSPPRAVVFALTTRITATKHLD